MGTDELTASSGLALPLLLGYPSLHGNHQHLHRRKDPTLGPMFGSKTGRSSRKPSRTSRSSLGLDSNSEASRGTLGNDRIGRSGPVWFSEAARFRPR